MPSHCIKNPWIARIEIPVGEIPCSIFYSQFLLRLPEQLKIQVRCTFEEKALAVGSWTRYLLIECDVIRIFLHHRNGKLVASHFPNYLLWYRLLHIDRIKFVIRAIQIRWLHRCHRNVLDPVFCFDQCDGLKKAPKISYKTVKQKTQIILSHNAFSKIYINNINEPKNNNELVWSVRIEFHACGTIEIVEHKEHENDSPNHNHTHAVRFITVIIPHRTLSK